MLKRKSKTMFAMKCRKESIQPPKHIAPYAISAQRYALKYNIFYNTSGHLSSEVKIGSMLCVCDVNWSDSFEKKTDKTISAIEKLAQLKEAGVLTEEEFDHKKKELLGMWQNYCFWYTLYPRLRVYFCELNRWVIPWTREVWYDARDDYAKERIDDTGSFDQ